MVEDLVTPLHAVIHHVDGVDRYAVGCGTLLQLGLHVFDLGPQQHHLVVGHLQIELCRPEGLYLGVQSPLVRLLFIFLTSRLVDMPEEQHNMIFFISRFSRRS